MTPETIPLDEWHREWGIEGTIGAADPTLPIWRVRFRVREVLKGQCEATSVDVIAVRGIFSHEVKLVEDEEYVLCLEYLRTLRGGTFYLRSDANVFSRPDRSWIHGSHKWLDEIRSRIETTKLPYVTAHADVIAVGRIRSIQTSVLERPDGRSATVREFSLDVISLLKGSLDADTLSFKVIDEGSLFPSWRVRYPRNKMNIGETWYVFLKKDEEAGYYPFAGKNGLLKVEGTELIYDGAVTYPKSKAQVDAEIEKALR